MKYTMSEKRVLRKLKIPDFNHITKDKLVQFVSMIPFMDPEVAKAALEQFPEFTTLAIDIVSLLKDNIDSLVAANERSQNVFYETCNKIVDSLVSELQDENIDSVERDRIENKMIEVAKMIGEKDSENKAFYQKMALSVAAVTLSVIGVAGALLGANFKPPIGSDDLETDSYDDIIDV